MSIVLLPVLDDEPIGHLSVDLKRRSAEGGVYLDWFEIRDPYVGQGIGSAMLAEAERVALAHQRHFAEIEVNKTNEDARRLYERRGYAVVGARQGSWIADTPDGTKVKVIEENWVMRKQLGIPGLDGKPYN